jgi:hypothetical protein
MKTKDKFAIEFALWINDNLYENYFNKKKSWVSLFDLDNYNEKEVPRYTIKELLKIFKDETNRTRQKRN